MAGIPIKLDHNGIAELLKSAEVTRATELVAQGVAANVRSSEPNYPVTVKMVTTDRAHALVTLATPAGMAVQAKRGSLTKAAAQAGLDVRSQP